MNSIEIGKFISNLRKEKGYTQMALAELLNVSNRTVSKWENGDGYPDITLLPEIASALGVTVDELLNAEKAPETELVIENKNIVEKSKHYSNICFVFSFFLGVFGALLGVGNKVYCTWAFSILYYTHWEIIFDAVALVAIVGSILAFILGVFELNHEADKSFFASYCRGNLRRSLISLALWSAFPLAFITRLFALSRWGNYTLVFVALICVTYVIANVCIYKKYSKK